LDHGLNAAVNRVREALGDSAEAPRFIETLPRRGYRFIGTIERGANAPRSAQLVIGSPPETAPPPVDLHSTRRRIPFLQASPPSFSSHLPLPCGCISERSAQVPIRLSTHTRPLPSHLSQHCPAQRGPLPSQPTAARLPSVGTAVSDQLEAFDLYAKIIGIDTTWSDSPTNRPNRLPQHGRPMDAPSPSSGNPSPTGACSWSLRVGARSASSQMALTPRRHSGRTKLVTGRS
jgi:hypothetical protein